MADESKTGADVPAADATVVMGVAAAAVAPPDDATVLIERPSGAGAVSADIGSEVVRSATNNPQTVSSETASAETLAAIPAAATAAASVWSAATQPGSASRSAIATGSRSFAAVSSTPAAPQRPLWLAVVLGVVCGLALFAATALVLLRG